MSQFLFRGFRISLLIHILIVSSVIYVGNLLPDVTPPMVIDFSLENDCANSMSPNCSEKIVKPVPDKIYQPSPADVSPMAKPEQVLNKPEKTRPEPEIQEQPKPEVQDRVVQQRVPIQRKVLSAIQKKVIVNVKKSLPEILSTQTPDKKNEATVAKVIEPAANLSQDSPGETPREVITEVVTVPAKPFKKTSLNEQYIKANYSYIRDVVESRIRYPGIARKMGWEGKVVVAFTVCDDGQVEDVRVIKSCGFTSLDKNAVKTITQCTPFPKPPVRAEVILPVTYRLN